MVPFVGYCNDDNNENAIIAQYMKEGLLDMLFNTFKKDKFPKWWDFTRQIVYLYGIAYGINYLHQNGIKHWNLNLDNIFIGENKLPKITGFSFSFLFLTKADKIPEENFFFFGSH